MTEQSEARPWSWNDQMAFDEDERTCSGCGEQFQVGQPVVERPPFSLEFYHKKCTEAEE